MNTIKHLVLSGGGPLIIYSFSILRELHKRKQINFDKLKSIHGTSSGSILSILLATKVNMDDIANYIVEFPFEKHFSLTFDKILLLNKRQGLIDKSLLDSFIDPILKTADIDINVTLKEFCDLSKIDLHIYCTDLNAFKSVDLNNIDYPDVKLKDALYSSCAIPVLFEPLYMSIDNKKMCLVDGGFFCNNPLGACMEKEYGNTFDNMNECQLQEYKNEICCVYYRYPVNNSLLDEKDNILSLLRVFSLKTIQYMELYENNNLLNYIDNKINIDLKDNNSNWVDLIKNKNIRKEIIEHVGITMCDKL